MILPSTMRISLGYLFELRFEADPPLRREIIKLHYIGILSGVNRYDDTSPHDDMVYIISSLELLIAGACLQ